MSSFIVWLKKHVCEDDAWITVHPNASGPGRPVLLDDEGYIKGGMGGKFNGQRIDLIPRKPKVPPSGAVTVPGPVRYNVPKDVGGGTKSGPSNMRGYNKIGETPEERKALAKEKVNALVKERLGSKKIDVDNIDGIIATWETVNKEASDAAWEAQRAGYAAERKAQDAYQKWKYPDENGDWTFYNDKTDKFEKVHFTPEQREEFRREYEREAATAERQEKIAAQYSEEHVITDRALKRLKETKIELDRRAKVEKWRNSPTYKAAQAVKEKNYAIPSGQVRFKTPLRVEGETEKAYKVSSTINETEAQYSAWVPKSRVTMKDGHVIGGEAWLKNAKAKEGLTIDNNNIRTPMTFDAAPSHRHFDENGFLHVDSSHITKEQVVKYYGREIPGWQALKLDPERLYNVYRPADEIEKSTTTFNGLPLLLTHHIESADEPQKDYRVGSVSAPVWNAPYLDAELHITDKAAIDAVENGEFKEISAAYLYEPVLERGTFDGTDYEIVMRNIRGNHVALVREGRAGPDVVVADEQPAPAPLRSFAAWMRKNPLALKDAPAVGWVQTKTAMDDAWITVHPNAGGKGSPVLLDDEGYIKGGMGGKFNGQRINLIPRKPKAPPSGEVSVPGAARYTLSRPSASAVKPSLSAGAAAFKNTFTLTANIRGRTKTINTPIVQTEKRLSVDDLDPLPPGYAHPVDKFTVSEDNGGMVRLKVIYADSGETDISAPIQKSDLVIKNNEVVGFRQDTPRANGRSGAELMGAETAERQAARNRNEAMVYIRQTMYKAPGVKEATKAGDRATIANRFNEFREAVRDTNQSESRKNALVQMLNEYEGSYWEEENSRYRK